MRTLKSALQDSFIAYDLGVNYEGYDTYLVYMEIKGPCLLPNENGKLISVVENYKTYTFKSNLKLKIPRLASMTSIYILKKRRHLKKQYNLKIKKERQAAN
jgi:hypothetical protein